MACERFSSRSAARSLIDVDAMKESPGRTPASTKRVRDWIPDAILQSLDILRAIIAFRAEAFIAATPEWRPREQLRLETNGFQRTRRLLTFRHDDEMAPSVHVHSESVPRLLPRRANSRHLLSQRRVDEHNLLPSRRPKLWREILIEVILGRDLLSKLSERIDLTLLRQAIRSTVNCICTVNAGPEVSLTRKTSSTSSSAPTSCSQRPMSISGLRSRSASSSGISTVSPSSSSSEPSAFASAVSDASVIIFSHSATVVAASPTSTSMLSPPATPSGIDTTISRPSGVPTYRTSPAAIPSGTTARTIPSASSSPSASSWSMT